MNKRISMLLIAVFFVVALIGCTNTTTATTTISTSGTEATLTYVALPDLTGSDRESITESLEGLGFKVKYYFDVSKIIQSQDEYDKFVKYGSDLKSGDLVIYGTEVRVYTTPLLMDPIYYNNLSEYDETLQLVEADYMNKEFIADGIGVVTAYRYVDGDTTFFSSGSEIFSVRYLGIDTPESTALYEPWGKTAALYTEQRLKSAETIVLQSEGSRQDANGRYLAWVWYRTSASEDFILLNLELVELAYSKNKVAIGSKYITLLTLADWNASMTRRRVWGELDPNYDYSKEGTQLSIQYLLENFDDYVGLKVVVTGTVTKMVGDDIFLQDENGYGIFMYSGFNNSTVLLHVGANVTIGALTPTYYSGSPQLSNFKTSNLTVNSVDNVVVPKIVTYDDFDFMSIGSLVTIENLTITGFNSTNTSIFVKDQANNSFTIRVDDSTQIDIIDLGLVEGDIITVTGPLSYYDYNFDISNIDTYVYNKSDFQLMLTYSTDMTKIEK